MALANHLQKVILVGASGNTGKSILSSMLASPAKFDITVLARPESKATLPSNVNVIRASYGPDADLAALIHAFEGQDVAIFCLAPAATMDQLKLIEAAAEAGVKWIVPNEWANDGFNKAMVDRVPGFLPKRQAREVIEAKGLKWIGFSTGPWPETSLRMSFAFGIDLAKRHVETWEAPGPVTMSTLPRVGETVAKVLALPLSNPADPRLSLEHYNNNFVYTSSFTATIARVFEAVRKATGTKEEDWTVQHHNEKRLELGEKLAREGGDMMQMMAHTMMGAYAQQGAGGDVEDKAKVDRETFGFEEEDIDEVVAKLVKVIENEPAPTWDPTGAH